MAAAAAPAQVEKINAFRSFATQLAGQVVEQLCQEYEREVSIMWNDLVQYRNELGRVAELLGGQLHRERQLHEMLEAMAGHHANIANSAQVAAAQSPNSASLHDMVDQLFGQHNAIVNSTLQGVSQARAIVDSHAQSAKQLQEPLISAENEYNRIMSILASPIVSATSPSATAARTDAMPNGQLMVAQRTPPTTPSQPQRTQVQSIYAPSQQPQPATSPRQVYLQAMQPAQPVQQGQPGQLMMPQQTLQAGMPGLQGMPMLSVGTPTGPQMVMAGQMQPQMVPNGGSVLR